jgi:hypothetical protein
MELRYDLPAREPDEELVAEWAVEISDTAGSFEDLMHLAEDFYEEADLYAETLGYNMGLATGKALAEFPVDEDSVRGLSYGLGLSAGKRSDDRVKVVDLFEYGVEDFEELGEEYSV